MTQTPKHKHNSKQFSLTGFLLDSSPSFGQFLETFLTALKFHGVSRFSVKWSPCITIRKLKWKNSANWLFQLLRLVPCSVQLYSSAVQFCLQLCNLQQSRRPEHHQTFQQYNIKLITFNHLQATFSKLLTYCVLRLNSASYPQRDQKWLVAFLQNRTHNAMKKENKIQININTNKILITSTQTLTSTFTKHHYTTFSDM